MATKRHKRLLNIIIAIACVLIAYAVFAFFQNKPNYRDLDNEYSSIPIPADWKQTDRKNETGLWGMFCLANDITCPAISVDFISNAPFNKTKDLEAINGILHNAGYMRTSMNMANCGTRNDYYRCIVHASKNDIEMQIIISGSDVLGKDISLGLTQNNE